VTLETPRFINAYNGCDLRLTEPTGFAKVRANAGIYI
jgi:hypothetical protein